MANDLQKYRAQNLQIAGFCLMSLFGKLILDVPEYKLSELSPWFFIYIFIAFALFILGIIVVFRGEVHLEERKQKWIPK